MVARRNRIALEVDNSADIQFFSDLVKPIQYRWKFQKEKLKTITPSKHGFHQRSQSPTFRRLVEANEKLRNIACQDADVDENATDCDFFDTKSEILPVKPSSILRYVKSEKASTRACHTNSIPADIDIYLQKDFELKSEVGTIEPAKTTKDYYVIQNNAKVEEEKRCTSPINESPQTLPFLAKSTKKLLQFKVDFKKLDSHSELHLFLPHIQECNSRRATPEEPNGKGKLGFTLPAIEDLEVKTLEEDQSKSKKQHKHDQKKKKKHSHRVKSGNEEKEVMDILNDIPTLISLETDRDFHPESICMFENCKLHRHRKSNRIRQT
ncbi:uncharacterized protein LOC123551454 isoform X2 [Mercenaria mercenaria]|nr:uncharacterized protein LOC123551454 isoform X2 [Mercenaria mercenaria]